MTLIDINLPERYFDKDRDNRLEARLAKFDLHVGDVMRFHEYDEDKQCRTGKHFDKTVTDFHKIHHATKYWTREDLDRYGIYVFELKD